MPEPITDQISILLKQASQGDEEAKSQVILAVYQDLRRIAQCYLKNETPTPSLQATALVHDVYLRLFGENQIEWQSKEHFMIVASRVMRRILVDHARSAHTAKRNHNSRPLSLESSPFSERINSKDFIGLNDALTDLERFYPRASQIVELRFFVGLTEEETAVAMSISAATVKREWKFARAWLYDQMMLGGALRAHEAAAG